MASSLEDDYAFFLSNRADLLKQHRGRVLVIKNHEVIGEFDDEADAVEQTRQNHRLGTFPVAKCDEEEELALYRSRRFEPVSRSFELSWRAC